MLKKMLLIFAILLPLNILTGTTTARIIRLKGEVKIRQGVDENWQPAKLNMLLEEMDTILTGDDAIAELELVDGKKFALGSSAQLDIADLRTISEQELFLYLMSLKVKKIDQPRQKTNLRLGNVSVVHGESKVTSEDSSLSQPQSTLWIQEKNGAQALYENSFYPNSIIKLNKIITNYKTIDDCGEIHYLLGQSFEAIKNAGQAMDAYETVLSTYRTQNCASNSAKVHYEEAQQAIKRLKQSIR
jgi:hypothetical protein